jgi:hypothetical protein
MLCILLVLCIRLVSVGYLGPRLLPCGVIVALLPLLVYVVVVIVVVVVVYLSPVCGRVLSISVYVIVSALCSGRHGVCVCVCSCC